MANVSSNSLDRSCTITSTMYIRNKNSWHAFLTKVQCFTSWGIPSPDGIPYGLADFFFFVLCFVLFFLPPHFRWPFVVKKTTDWAEILHNHTYGHASGRGKKYFRCAHFQLSYLSKITQKSAQ